ncbi:chromosome partition protein MukE [Endozoicomonas sp. 8E]|uniref:chromosome partition protein MukE n=1 Tax=Endozoicomonas sp. 8E TaxID=3035692 RepID=UPI002938D8E9|nr:chromosome partition protein MukE [Endozoicomonas sp. 8E]WOG30181.1 chromosome partition protein MukE [Endozoicomonas sp. 8E]
MNANNPYQTLADVINDDLFPELDSRLRRGEHIDARHTHLYSMLQAGETWLDRHYQRYGIDLICAQEDYYYLQPKLGNKNLIRSKKLDELSMVLGQLLALYHLDPEQLEGGGWIQADSLFERLRMLVSDERLARLLDRKKIDTQMDREKAMETLKRSLRQLAKLGMIRMEGMKADRVQTQSPLMRFIEPVRSSQMTRESLEKLVQSGSISLEADEEVADESVTDEILNSNVPATEDSGSVESNEEIKEAEA